jgi:hypothetical protein
MLLTFVQLDLFITSNFGRSDSEASHYLSGFQHLFFSDQIHVAFYRLLCVVELEKMGERN